MTVIAEESCQNIRTVKAFSNEDSESMKFKEKNEDLYKIGRKKAIYTGISSATSQIFLYCAMALVIYVAKILF